MAASGTRAPSQPVRRLPARTGPTRCREHVRHESWFHLHGCVAVFPCDDPAILRSRSPVIGRRALPSASTKMRKRRIPARADEADPLARKFLPHAIGGGQGGGAGPLRPKSHRWIIHTISEADLIVGDQHELLEHLPLEWCDEASVAHWNQEVLAVPDWNTAEEPGRIGPVVEGTSSVAGSASGPAGLPRKVGGPCVLGQFGSSSNIAASAGSNLSAPTRNSTSKTAIARQEAQAHVPTLPKSSRAPAGGG